MELETLLEGIGLPSQVADLVREQLRSPFPADAKEAVEGLTHPQTAPDAYRTLEKVLGGNDMAMLACQLQAAAAVHDRYRLLGIPDEIYFDTMKCFPRFLEETRRRRGRYVYDRAWWSWRQVSMTLFRVGALEYELLPGERAISLHIPSDACFSPEDVDRSLAEAGRFFERFFPGRAADHRICESWLLSPELGKLLEPGSHIRSFQSRFRILREEPENRDFLEWLFGADTDTPPEALSETTSLQRRVKAHLLEGGRIGAALGILK